MAPVRRAGGHGGELARWQRLFFAFYTCFASTNSFAQGGGLSFAPILQNNPLQLLLGHARKWANGERPDRVGFRVETKWEEKDCSHYVPVAELYGLLNLDRHPFYNGPSGETYAALVGSADASAYDGCEAVGAWTAPFLAEHPEAERELAARFRARVEEAAQPPWLWMEGVRGSKSLRQAAEAETRVDAALQSELGRLAVAKAREWTDRQAAAALLHLAIDAFIYLEQGKRCQCERRTARSCRSGLPLAPAGDCGSATVGERQLKRRGSQASLCRAGSRRKRSSASDHTRVWNPAVDIVALASWRGPQRRQEQS